MLDVGTNNEALRDDPLYIGLARRSACAAREYDALRRRVRDRGAGGVPRRAASSSRTSPTPTRSACCASTATRSAPSTTTSRAPRRWRSPACSRRMRITGGTLADQHVLFLGAGRGRHRHRRPVVAAMVAGPRRGRGPPRCWFVDSQGAGGEEPHRPRGAQAPLRARPRARRRLARGRRRRWSPRRIIGVSRSARPSREPVLGAMAAINERPIVFALSNPTSQGGVHRRAGLCAGRTAGALFASGSPFAPGHARRKDARAAARATTPTSSRASASG